MRGERPPDVLRAFGELGLAPDASPEETRRAYLRQVKLHKPEADPEGFRRAREAYDLLVRWHRFAAAAEAMADRDSSPQDAPPPASGGDGPPPADGGEPPLPASSGASPWPEALRRLRAGPVLEARARVRELLEDGPPPPALIGVLVQALLAAQAQEPGPDATATLRAVVAWVQRLELELRLPLPATQWLLVKELAALPIFTLPWLEQGLAELVLSGDLAGTGRLAAAARKLGSAYLDAVASLARNAPRLHQLAEAMLPPPEASPGAEALPAPQGRRVPFHLAWLVVGGVLALARLGGPSPNQPVRLDPPPPARPAIRLGPVEQICVFAARDCPLAREIQALLDARDCAGAERRLQALAAPLEPRPEADQAAVDEARAAFRTRLRFCKLP